VCTARVCFSPSLPSPPAAPDASPPNKRCAPSPSAPHSTPTPPPPPTPTRTTHARTHL
jgi:hypothetical protein